MTPRPADLLQQLQAQSEQLASSQEELQRTREELTGARREIELLRQKVDAMVRRLFGAKSEKLDPAQLLLLLQGFDEAKKAPEPVAAEAPRRSAAPSPPRERSPRLPEHLPVIEEVIVPAPVQAAPEQWRRIGEEVSERLDYKPAQFLRLRTVRPKYVQKGLLDAVPVIAPLPPRLLERSIVAPGLLAQILAGKYCDHLPLYRQEYIYWSRHGVWLPRQTMAEWVGLAADWLKPIYEHIRAEVLSAGYVQVDETPIRYLAPGNGKTKLGYLWACNAPGGDVVFQWATTRAASCLETIIPVSWEGKLQCDAYEAYDCFARSRGGKIKLAGCMAHVRRKFYGGRETAPKVAGWLLQQFQKLYELEDQLRQARAGPELRQAERSRFSRPMLARMHRVLVQLKAKRHYLPQSLMGKAVDYALRQWSWLLLYLEDGRMEIDNNLVENAIRPTAIGKKNWLFIGEAEAGERGAIIYTIIEACRRRGIDPFAYLQDVFTRLPSMTNWQVKDITPEAWAKARANLDQRAAA
jgi:transposase